jgi:acetyltransferase-like isoleucine patch superfamily enzyme
MAGSLIRLPGLLLIAARRASRRLRMLALRPLFRKTGRRFRFDPDGHYSFSTITVGDDVFVGPGAFFSASESFIHIGNKVMFGPNVTILCGDHRFDVVGLAMADVTEKRPEDDCGVTIADDVWVGAGATVLKGVSIRRGAVVAAGAIVTREVPPYAIVAGCPARVVRSRFSETDQEQHERLVSIAKGRDSATELRKRRNAAVGSSAS